MSSKKNLSDNYGSDTAPQSKLIECIDLYGNYASTTNHVYFGFNEDRELSQFNQETTIYFLQATDTTYGYMEVRAEAPGIWSLRVGMNSQGIAISGNGLPESSINVHPEKTYTRSYHNFYKIVLESTGNISDVIELIDNFDFGSSISAQIHIADAQGNALVLSPGSDGEMEITHKVADYLVSTNTNQLKEKALMNDLRYLSATHPLKESITKQSVLTALDYSKRLFKAGCIRIGDVLFDII